MNKSDSERVATVLEDIGYLPASNLNKADLIVVNACSVRQSAIDRIWGQTQNFEKLKIENSKLKTVLIGCVLKKDKRKFAKKFDLILDIKDSPKLPEILRKETNAIIRPWLNYYGDYLKIKPKHQNEFSAFVPIMTGCNNFCTFCVVPYTRGRETFRSAEEITCEIKNLIKRGYKEIWLLGQNVNSYNSGKINFPKLLKMLNDIPGNFWIRFTSSHPKDFSDELIDTMANCQKVTEYLNLPVQSGDNEILRKMNRPYIIEQYKEGVRKIQEKIPNIALSTDVIVGFPGETEKQFENTAKLFKEIKYDMAYIAQYSPRPETAAAKLRDNVSFQEKERRWKILADILKEIALEKNKKYVGKMVEVLPEDNKNGFLISKTRTYKTVKFKGPEDLIGQFVKVKILKALPWGLKGEIEK
jgi:tRNA-2-methylthio-N6-dimethylallyladenosine synthase